MGEKSGRVSGALDAPCSHESADGIDQTPLNDPAKVWRCNECGATFTTQSQSRPLTVRDLLVGLIDLPEGGDLGPTHDAVVQVTADGEHFYAIDRVEDQGLDGVWLVIVPHPPDSGATPT